MIIVDTNIVSEPMRTVSRFADEILAFDAVAALSYAEIVDRRDRLGAPSSGYEAQIAALCRVHGAPPATRNTKDFANTGVQVLNPWTA